MRTPTYPGRVKDASDWLRERASGVLAAPAQTALVGWLERRLAACTATVGTAPNGRYPVLDRLLETSRAAWRAGCAGFVERVARDLAGVGVAEVTCLTGELAAWPVLRVGCEDGRALVYRDRDLRVATWFMGLCSALSEGLPAALHVRRIVAFQSHAWDLVVERAPCPQEAVERFFLRVGALQRLLERLRATDMHARNLVAAADHPVLIDLEGLLQPVELGPMPTGLLPFVAVGEPGRPGPNVGGIHLGGRIVLPFPPHIVEEVAPTVPANPLDHLDAILEGYHAMDVRLTRFAALGARLAEARALPVRVLLRSGSTYRAVLRECLAPELLHDPATRDRVMVERLAAAGPPPLPEELVALREHRVPHLTAPAGPHHLGIPADPDRVRRAMPLVLEPRGLDESSSRSKP